MQRTLPFGATADPRIAATAVLQLHGRELCYIVNPSSIRPTEVGCHMATTRRLAAILAADVAGYSRLMGADEEGTHRRLQAHLAELVRPTIEGHRGRVVKTPATVCWQSSLAS
jgi:class 3 adenylate cyclase